MEFIGKVVSTKMNKTAVVRLSDLFLTLCIKRESKRLKNSKLMMKLV